MNDDDDDDDDDDDEQVDSVISLPKNPGVQHISNPAKKLVQTCANLCSLVNLLTYLPSNLWYCRLIDLSAIKLMVL